MIYLIARLAVGKGRFGHHELLERIDTFTLQILKEIVPILPNQPVIELTYLALDGDERTNMDV
ncbi:hypothetical protein Alches_19920 [Alicyclobacillus hesperidum subsp. aegles]|nr:hypothetical protein Alches_19920 [Alicyclobacillus hesperidum subsp. aegles]